MDSLETLRLDLPPSIEFFDEARKNANLYLLFVMEQLAFREFDTFQFDFEIANQRIPEISRFRDQRARGVVDLESFFNTFAHRAVAVKLFYVIEAARLERKLTKRFPGLKRFHNVRREYFEQELKRLEHPLERMLQRIKIHFIGDDLLDKLWSNRLDPVIDENADVYKSAKATVQCYLQLFGDSHFMNEEVDESAIETPTRLESLQRIERLESWESELDNMNGLIDVAESLAIDSASSSDNNDEIGLGEIRSAELQARTRERDQRARKVDIERSNLGIHNTSVNRHVKQFRYDEWDYINNTWKKSLCTLYEIRSDTNPSEKSAQIVKSTRPLVRAVRKNFEQVRPSGMRRRNKMFDGDEMDLTSVVEARVDLRSSHSADERVYSQRVRIQRDVSAMFLVDLSASTDDSADPKPETSSSSPDMDVAPQDMRDPFFDDDFLNGNLTFEELIKQREEQRKIIDIEKESVLVLATALEEIGDLYSVCGFSGYGRDNVELFLAQDFNEPLSQNTINAIVNMKPM